MRWRITIEYDGGSFSGWQRQDNAPSIQQSLEESLFKFSGCDVTIHGAGRTDSGVHACGQVAHFDMPDSVGSKFSIERICGAFNYHLGCSEIGVIGAEQVSDDFDARFSAVSKIYHYDIIMRRYPVVLERDFAWRVGYDLDISSMGEACVYFIGKHDFSAFRASSCQALSAVRTLDRLEIEVNGERVRIIVEARSFLHHQVRNIVGALVSVGRGRISAESIEGLLLSCDRTLCPETAPARGLCLWGVFY